ncbi:hypothetical protein [Streptomyces rubiginosohelvolus]|uniref:hypothetical protein n=1 Tax=Streptomyces rubiginosohelvolus TaxID=67362 RepID=UPI0036A3124A
MEGAVEVCLWPEHEKYVPMVRAVNEKVASLPDGFKIPDRLSEYGTKQVVYATKNGQVVQREGDIDISEGSRWALSLGVADAVTKETFQGCDWAAVRKNEDFTTDVLNRWIETFLAGGGRPDYRVGAGAPPKLLEAFDEAAAIAETSTEEQLVWVEEKLQHVNEKYCD